MRKAFAQLTILEGVLVLASAALIVWTYGSLFVTTPPSRFVPAYADEIYYHKQAESFAAAGFAHGNWGGEREASPIGGCDVHGCGFMLVTGTFARLFGWSLASLVWFNLTCILLAFAAGWLLLPRPRAGPALLGAAVVLTSGVSIIYVESGMQEVLHLVGVVVLAIIAWRLAREPERRRWAIAYLAIASALALVRFNWIVTLPLVALLMPSARRARRAAWATAGLVLAVAIYGLAAVTRPTGSFHSPLLQPATSHIGAVLANTVGNLRSLITLSDTDGTVIAMRVLWALSLIAVAIALLRRPRSSERTLVAWAWSHLAIMTVLQVGLYWCFFHADYRLISTPLVGVLLALALTRDRVLFPALLAIQLVTAPLALKLVNEWNAGRSPSPSVIAARTIKLAPIIGRARHPGPGRWCDTVAVELELGPRMTLSHLLSMPEGYGIEIVRRPASSFRHPARFLVAERPAPTSDLELLGIWEPGIFVYENPRCGS